MAYKFGHRTKPAIKTRLIWTLAFLTAFALGGFISALLLLRINHAYGLTGPKVTKDKTVAKTDFQPTLTSSSNKPSTSSKAPSVVAGTVAGAETSTQGLRLTDCGVSAALHAGLAKSSVAQLKKLAEYEKVCSGGLASTVSFFAATPSSSAEAADEASWVSGILKEYARQGITPLVFFEPSGSNGILDLKAYSLGSYDGPIKEYFAGLKSRGVTDAMMGTWVALPEGNIPVWNNVDPGDFTAVITRTVQIQKSYFPGSKAAVMLQSMTYPSGTSWAGGTYKSFLPYVQNIPKGLIDSFGLQGFAWPPTAPGDSAQLDPKSFLRIDFAAEAARNLGTKNIWINTGTFGRSFVVSRSSPYLLTPEQRQNILNGIAQQARGLAGQGFTTSVHLFAEDKSATSEAIDWSYWTAGSPDTSLATAIFKTFVHDLNSASISLWLYDSAK